MTGVLQRLNTGLAALTRRVQGGIVQVQTGRAGGGTGIIIEADGTILTNAHVVHRSGPRVILADGRCLEGRVVACDRSLDLAVLTIEAEALPVIPLGAAATVKPGDWVLAVGHPWGMVGAATAGVIVGHRRGRRPGEPSWVVADVQLRPGNSGGPLVDGHGRVVGVNTLLIGPDLGVAVPAEVVRRFLAAG